MPADTLTFFLGFAAVFGALAWYLWHLERQVAALRRRVEDAEAVVRERLRNAGGATPPPQDDAGPLTAGASAAASAGASAPGHAASGRPDEPDAATPKGWHPEEGP